MKRKLVFAGAILAAVGTGAIANEAYDRLTVTDLYVLRGANCIKVANAGGIITYPSVFQDAGAGTQAAIVSNGNTQHLLFEDAGCSTTPVYFN